MKLIKIIFFLILAMSLFSCNKSDKVDIKDNKNSSQQTSTDNTNKNVNYKFYNITKSEPSGKDKTAPEISWNENGKDMKLSDLRGNVVLINIWATWCKPCVAEMPDLSLISQELKDKNFKIIGISNEDSKTIENFLKVKPVDYIILSGTDETLDVLGKAYGKKIEAFPTTIIINKEGKIVEYVVGSQPKQGFMNYINKHL